MKEKLSFYTGAYFEWPMKLVGAVFMAIGVGWVFQNVFGGVLMLIGGAATFLTNYCFVIHPGEKWYQDGVSMFGLKFGVKNSYDTIEYLFVKPNKVSRTYNLRVQSSTITDLEFDGYIRFSEHDKVHLFSAKNKQQVIDKLVVVSKSLNVRIVDYTREVTDLI